MGTTADQKMVDPLVHKGTARGSFKLQSRYRPFAWLSRLVGSVPLVALACSSLATAEVPGITECVLLLLR